MYVRGTSKRPCPLVYSLAEKAWLREASPLAAGSAATPSKQFCQTCEAFVNLTVNTRRYCVLTMFMIVYLDMKIFLD